MKKLPIIIFWRQVFQGTFQNCPMPPMQQEEHDEEVSTEVLEDSECGPLSISKLEVSGFCVCVPVLRSLFLYISLIHALIPNISNSITHSLTNLGTRY